MNEEEVTKLLNDNEEVSALSDEERAALEAKVKAMVDEELPPIVTMTDPRAEVLALVSRPCSIPPTPDDIQASSSMIDMMEVLGDNAVAIAAPQIGVPRRFFVMRLASGEVRSFFNPVILKQSATLSKKPEGCLSIPGASVRVTRPRSVTLQYIDITGELQEETFSGLQARAVCHEIDHLNGRVIMEHMVKEAERQTRITGIKKREKAARTNKRRAKNKLRRRANQRNRR